ncbi:MAG: sulfotransferase family protein [Acidimicrobiia bacterium]|nr:sulfotransferase family protein [Acidimicrobiia bacterium]
MGLKVVGAGVGRTGTHSLKVALENLLGEPCYHMIEVFGHPDHVHQWHQAALGDMPDWDELFTGYGAAVDWPAAAFWEEQAAAFPDAVILLSTRDGASWWRSCHNTIFEVQRTADEKMPREWTAMANEVIVRRFADGALDEASAVAAFERHNDHVRATAPADRLVEWQPGDGWGPLCEALGVAVPDEPFPHVNSTAEFRAMAGLDS